MDVINEIAKQSALAELSILFKGIVLFIFTSIVSILMVMLLNLFLYGPYMNIQ
jgi:hypothetical protein